MSASKNDKVRLMLVDDHAFIRSGIRSVLAEEADLEIVAEAENGTQALETLKEWKVDIVLMDISMGDMSGIEATRAILEQHPEIKIIALTMHEDEEYFFNMLEAGASGYVPKRAAEQELITAIRVACRDEVYIYPSLTKLLVRDHLRGPSQPPASPLTERESQVLAVLAEGLSNQEIAERLSISPKTVGRHRENIMRKLGLHNRTELVKYAIRKGIIQA